MKNSSNTMQYIVLRKLDGNITFTHLDDEKLLTTFKEWDQIGVVDSLQHQELLGILNSCEWDKVVDVDSDLNVIKKDKYTPQEREAILLERAKEEKKAFFEQEKKIALAINTDYRLQLEPITEVQMVEVMEYLKSIKPSEEILLKIVIMELPRPELMEVYEERLGLS